MAADVDDPTDELLLLAERAELPREEQAAAGVRLAHAMFRAGRQHDMFALRDLTDAAYEAFDDTKAALVKTST